jgi:hypothetical protein
MSKFTQDFHDLNYLRGVVDTTLNYYEVVNKEIDSEKDLYLYHTNLSRIVKHKGLIIGYKITFTWITELKHTRDVDDPR